eukprot:m.165731 g.165731  ORF g.165731 m.165731 type:complete len:54 (-) comp15234_c5_seq10:268-429(-)
MVTMLFVGEEVFLFSVFVPVPRSNACDPSSLPARTVWQTNDISYSSILLNLSL